MKKQNINLISMSFTIIISLLILCVTLFAWFSKNEKVGSSFESTVGSGDIKISSFKLYDQTGEEADDIHGLLLQEDIYFEIAVSSLNDIPKKLNFSFLSIDGGAFFTKTVDDLEVLCTDENGKTFDMRDCFTISLENIKSSEDESSSLDISTLSSDGYIDQKYTSLSYLSELDNNTFLILNSWDFSLNKTLYIRFKMTFDMSKISSYVPVNAVSKRSLSISSILVNGVNLE